MNEAMLIADLNRDRTRELWFDGCRRCARTRVRWLKTEFLRFSPRTS